MSGGEPTGPGRVPHLAAVDESGLAVELVDVYKHYTHLATAGRRRFLGFEGRKAKNWVIKGVNATLPAGTATGIVGRNGAGKSTLLRLMAGVTVPTKGQVICHLPNPCMLAFGAGVNDALSGREYATTLGMLAGLRKSEVVDRMPEIQEYSGIGGSFDQPLRTYSQGMRMRVGFSALMHSDPSFLLIDEALAVGDRQFKEKCMVTLRTMIDAGATVVFTSHSSAPVRTLCEHAIWIHDGEVRMDGDITEVMDAYDDPGSVDSARLANDD